MTRFEPRTSGFESDRSTNWATTTAQWKLYGCFFQFATFENRKKSLIEKVRVSVYTRLEPQLTSNFWSLVFAHILKRRAPFLSQSAFASQFLQNKTTV